MILDALAKIESATGFDLEAVRPGPGQPIKLFGTGLVADTDLIINTGADAAEADQLEYAERCVEELSDAEVAASSRDLRAVNYVDTGAVQQGSVNQWSPQGHRLPDSFGHAEHVIVKVVSRLERH